MTTSFSFLECFGGVKFAWLGFLGSKYAGINKHSGGHLVIEWLDKGFCSSDLLQLSLLMYVRHLPRLSIDHCPLLVQMYSHRPAQSPRSMLKPFHMLVAWFEDPQLRQLVQLHWNFIEGSFMHYIIVFPMMHVVQSSSIWQYIQAEEGNSFSVLQGIQHSFQHGPFCFLSDLEKELTIQYEKILKQEKVLWFQKAKAKWFADGKQKHGSFMSQRSSRKRRRRRLYPCYGDQMILGLLIK